MITRTARCLRQLPLAALPSTRAIPNRDVFYACRAVPSRRSFNEDGSIREGASLIPFAPFAEIASDVYTCGFIAVITTPASPARQSQANQSPRRA